jgi:plasmid stabilization system protein ParE
VLAYVAQDAPSAAEQLLLNILDAGASLATLSERGRAVPEWGSGSVREILVDPFRLVYDIRDTEVIVLAVLHQRQDFTRFRERQLRRPDAP